jgi:FkbM family methyltransferase
MRYLNITAFNNKTFQTLIRDKSVDYDMCISVMIEDAYRLKYFPLKPGMTAIDLGAHIGTVTLMLASQGAKTYSVEPVPENVQMLEYNIEKNGLKDLVKIYPYALASEKTTITLHYQKEQVHHYIARTSNTTIIPEHYIKSINVETITLEQIFEENDIKHCHLIKTDIEGAEWDAFKNIPDHILERIDVILGEIHKFNGTIIDSSSLLPLLKGYFYDASPIYHNIDHGPGKADLTSKGGIANFIYIRKGLKAPIQW